VSDTGTGGAPRILGARIVLPPIGIPPIFTPPVLTPIPGEVTPDLVVEVIRPIDLVALRVEAFGLSLVTGPEPVLRAGDGGGHLVVHLSFQHMTERAVYELGDVVVPSIENDSPPAGPDAIPHTPPEPAIAANGSRVVFEVAGGLEIAYSTEGILAAIATLPMAVHPLAAPRPVRRGFPDLGTGFTLGGDLVAVATGDALLIGNATNARPAASIDTARGLNRVMRDRRVARAIAARIGAVGVAGTTLESERGRTTDVRVGDRTFAIPTLTRPGGILGLDLEIARPRRRPTLSRPPTQLETALEVPYRLVVTPSAHGGWAHSERPVGSGASEDRVELWHTRLGVRQTATGGEVTVNETSTFQRILRAIWARDRDLLTDWETNEIPHGDFPFRMSLDSADRHILVRQTSETWLGDNNRPIQPEPVDVRKLYLSATGAWLNAIGTWDPDPYTDAELSAIESWEHIAPMGRDQFVKVVYPGYLFPFGHRASLVKLTERKMKTASPSLAALFQRKFLIVKQPVLRYSSRAFPVTEIRVAPIVTPTLVPDPGPLQDTCFVPQVANQPFPFVLHMRDQEDRPVRVTTPLVWVSNSFGEQADPGFADVIRGKWKPHARVAFSGQKVAYAEVAKGGDTLAKTDVVTFDATPHDGGGSTPTMVSADVTIDAVEQLSGVGTTRIGFHQAYLDNGFSAPGNAGEVWAQLVRDAAPNEPLEVVPDSPKVMSFGQGSPSGSDKAGGFIQPNVAIGGLSRLKGTVNDLGSTATGGFDPQQFLGAALPKLFGVVDLIDLLDAVGALDEAPDVVSETLDRIEGFIEDLERAKRIVDEAVAEANRLVQRATNKAQELQDQANAALAAAQALKAQIDTAVDDVLDELQSLVDQGQAAVETALNDPLTALRTAVTEMRSVAPLLPPAIRSRLQKLADVLETLLDAADLVEDIVRFLNGLASSSVQFTYRYEWVPPLKSWPAAPPHLLVLKKDSLVLAVEGRLDGKGDMGIEVLAELRDFALHLMPGLELVHFSFDHLSFKAGTSGKAEVDVVMGDIEFVGFLGFIQKLRELIPFDGFSDPPYLDVTAEGLTAGFSVDLPNVAVGVFSLSNMSLGADIRVPFLGETVSVGFNFCTRDRPFTLAVLFIGGGGFFGLRLGPDRLLVLELCLEAGATLSVDFGVASGSISAMVGIYMRLEGDAGSLAGYFRLRGEVDVLGLISASIELYLELHYDFPTGKMIGRAKLTIKVEVLFFSASVTIEAERRLAGSNGDPNFIDVMGLEPDGTSPAWSDYCLAFAEA
jgi:chaperonin cofactor prefoldin